MDLKKKVKGFLDFGRLFRHLSKQEAKDKFKAMHTSQPKIEPKQEEKKK